MNDNDLATLRKENVQLRRHIEELRALLPTLRTEAAELLERISWQKRWIKELQRALPRKQRESVGLLYTFDL